RDQKEVSGCRVPGVDVILDIERYGFGFGPGHVGQEPLSVGPASESQIDLGLGLGFHDVVGLDLGKRLSEMSVDISVVRVYLAGEVGSADGIEKIESNGKESAVAPVVVRTQDTSGL